MKWSVRRRADDDIAQIANNQSWIIWARNFNKPEYLKIAGEGQKNPQTGLYNPRCGAEVFERMRLDLEQLSQIFVPEPHKFYTIPGTQREKQPIAADYNALGTLRVWDDEGWIALAKLAQKHIHLYHNHGINTPSTLRGIFEPDGSYAITNPDAGREFIYPGDPGYDTMKLKMFMHALTGGITSDPGDKVQ